MAAFDLKVVIFRTELVPHMYFSNNMVESYESFSEETNPYTLSLNLLKVSKYEKEIYRHLTKSASLISRHLVIDGNAFQLAYNHLTKINSLDELYDRDDAVLIEGYANMYHYNALAVVVLVNNMYRGHVYAWTFENRNDNKMRVMNIMGIRTSMYHLLSRFSDNPEPSLAPVMLNGLRQYCNNHYPDQDVWLRIVSPMPVMQRIAAKLGFSLLYSVPKLDWLKTEIEDDIYFDEDWLAEESYIGGGPVTSEEESYDKTLDYVLNTKTPLKAEGKLIDLTIVKSTMAI